MSGSERPERRAPGYEVTVDDVRQLMGASTPHFALHIRDRIAALVRGLPVSHPARLEGEREIARLERLAALGRGPRDGRRARDAHACAPSTRTASASPAAPGSH